jgi:undecaprenyl-diphosphatase
MTITQAVIAGFVQGITEFFPISSSGHLVILHHLFGLKEAQLAFDVFLHLGTVAAVVVFFWKDIVALFDNDKQLLWFLALGSVPTFVIGFLFKDVIEQLFVSPRIVGWMLLVTGGWIAVASLVSSILRKANAQAPVGIVNSLIIGVAQGIAIMPGISRSGATISTGLLLGLNERSAVRF